jgi:hypothetical protein
MKAKQQSKKKKLAIEKQSVNISYSSPEETSTTKLSLKREKMKLLRCYCLLSSSFAVVAQKSFFVY